MNISGEVLDENISDMNNTIDICDDECKNTIWGFWIEGVAVPFIAFFGIFGNLACVFVFNHKSCDLKPSFSNILKCLSIYDMALLMGVLILYGFPNISMMYKMFVEPHTTPIILPLTQVALTGSVYSVVVVATERYFSICKPFHKNWGAVCEGFGYVSVVVIFSFLYNITKFWEFETVYENQVPGDDSSPLIAKMTVTELRKNPIYHTVYVVTNTLVMGLLPLLALAFLNWRIIKAMNAATRRHNNIASLKRRDRAMTGLLTGVVVVLVVCHTPKTIMNLSESYHLLRYGARISESEEPLWGKIVIKFSHLLLTLSSAINILIYSYKDFKFRAVLRSLCGHKILDRNSQEESVIKDREGMTTTTTLLPCRSTVCPSPTMSTKQQKVQQVTML